MTHDTNNNHATSATTGHHKGMTNDLALDAGPASLGDFRRLQNPEKFRKAWVKGGKNTAAENNLK